MDVNGLKNDKMETELFSSSNAVDILLISETHFTDKDCFKIVT